MASQKTLEIQKKKHVESKREWLWISTKLDPKNGTQTRGLTYRKPSNQKPKSVLFKGAGLDGITGTAILPLNHQSRKR